MKLGGQHLIVVGGGLGVVEAGGVGAERVLGLTLALLLLHIQGEDGVGPAGLVVHVGGGGGPAQNGQSNMQQQCLPFPLLQAC